MTVVAALLMAAGALLIASPWLWPRTDQPRERRASGALADLLARAGLSTVSPVVLIVVMLLLALVAAAAVFVVVPVLPLVPVAAVVAGVLPIVGLRARAAARRRALRGVWPDVVDHLVSGIRAGLGLPEAIGALGETAPDAVRGPFRQFRREWTSTARFGDSLDGLKTALADPVADRIIETLRMAREVGGTELPGVLRSLAQYLRSDAAVRAEVDARQSWVRNAARLGVAAPWIVLLLLGTRPEAAAAYNSPTGAALIVGGLAATLIAYRLMLALGRLPEEGRWFR
ncbi:type II secretion system F family protein [Microcella daejeonensis]|uniref:type II secretion system F family protein n=1 Tax=Microcella daejeonensis TaxID=2994971 RepID=UPI00226F4030|nr:type II secretion system F family protein [Microcella daejeonensis]WAB82983.1 type II secretion system F family protein [Microcella daejeonensis]